MRHPTKLTERKTAVFGCKHTTRDLIAGLDRHGFRIDHCVTIAPEKAAEQNVAGYHDLRPFLDSRGIPFTVAHKYNLKSQEDQAALLDLGLDLIFVMGWQRLIPDWLLRQLSIGAFGMHGSSKPLPHGRGRSPMNWSLIQNKDRFYTHLFQYKPGVDDGPIAAVQIFDIHPHDTCLTLHHKNMVAMQQLCVKNLPALLDGTIKLQPQPTEGSSYYPKRESEDGLIYWSDSTLAIYNLIRAVTRPFPGAFSYCNDEEKIVIWRAIPFDTRLTWPSVKPGEIVEVFYDGTFVVKTGDASLLVQEYEGVQLDETNIGRVLTDRGQPRKQWENLPE